jgi:hypothetical protein
MYTNVLQKLDVVTKQLEDQKQELANIPILRIQLEETHRQLDQTRSQLDETVSLLQKAASTESKDRIKFEGACDDLRERIEFERIRSLLS